MHHKAADQKRDTPCQEVPSIFTDVLAQVLRIILKQIKTLQLLWYVKCKCPLKNLASNIQSNNFLLI